MRAAPILAAAALACATAAQRPTARPVPERCESGANATDEQVPSPPPGGGEGQGEGGPTGGATPTGGEQVPSPPLSGGEGQGEGVPAGEIRLALVGDVMLGSSWPDESGLPPDDAQGLLAEAAPVLAAADLAFGNLEGPMIDGGETSKCAGSKPGRCYAFRMPTRYAALLRAAGFAAMSLANNHAGDFGAEGRASTRRALDAAGVGHAGEPGDEAHFLVRGRGVRLVAFATSDATNDLRDLDGVRALVAAAAASGDLVVVSFHGGAEGAGAQHVPAGAESFYGEERGDLRAFARTAVDAGAAVVFGHGPHVVRGLELYRGRLVAYSLGNFATWDAFNLMGPNGLAPVLEVRLGPDGAFRGGRIHAFRQDRPGGPRRDPAGEVIRRFRELSEEDFGDAAARVEEGGLLADPAPSG